MSPEIGRTLDEALDRLDQVRADLQFVASKHQTRTRRASETKYRLKASVYIWIPAMLEEFLLQISKIIIHHINAANVPKCDILPRSHACVATNHFQSMSKSSGLKIWAKRIEIVDSVSSSEIVTMTENCIPSDGRTPKFDHLDILWGIFQISGKPAPQPVQQYKLFLEDLSEQRNRLAHGRVDPKGFGRSHPTRDMKRKVANAEKIVRHIAIAVDNYLATACYKK